MTYVQAVSSSSSGERRSSKGTVASSPKGASSGHSKPSQMLSGSKSLVLLRTPPVGATFVGLTIPRSGIIR